MHKFCTTQPVKYESASSLAHDIHNYLIAGADTADLTLICNERRYPVHKAILAARSDVFATMFGDPCSDMKEATTKEVKIEDVDSKTLDMFLK